MSDVILTVTPSNNVITLVASTIAAGMVVSSAPINIAINNNSVSLAIASTTPDVLVSSMGVQGLQGTQGLSADQITYVAGEALVSHQPIALVEGLAYKMNYLNPLHQYGFIGFSKTSAIQGGPITVETVKIDLAGWGLVPNQTYMAGASGALITTNNTINTFSKIIGFSQSATSMLIIKHYTSINKN